MRGAYAFHRTVENTYLVRERDRRRVRELVWVLLLVIPLALGFLVTVLVQHELVRTGYRIHELELDLESLERQERALKVRAATLARPQAVHQRAVTELGMREPGPENTVYAENLE